MQPLQLTGFHPFWFWNDRLSAEEIRWQIQAMAAQGIRGFFIHSRQGLQQPYLSTAFFDMVDVALAAAEEYGLAVHLYDEYPYPSGIAGGEVILGQPQYAATQLKHLSLALSGGHVREVLPAGHVLACMVYPMQDGRINWAQGRDVRAAVGMTLTAESYRETGLTAYNQKRYFASEPRPVLELTLPDQPHQLVVSIQSEVRHFKYWDGYVDVLNPEAIAEYMQLTHERYRQHYADQFGRRIASIFTDELTPEWSYWLPKIFQDEYGYDLCAALPALLHRQHPDHLRVAYDLYRLKYRLFCESYEQSVADWCRKYGLAYAGEKPALRLAQLWYMDIPGCDPGHIKVGAKPDLLRALIRQNAKAVASAGYFYGKRATLCECYHSLGWSATIQDAKYIAEGLLLMGISMLVPHGFFYSTHALKKHDAPPSFFFQMPFWPLFGNLSARVEWLQQLFAGTYIDARILVVEPSSGLPTEADLEIYVALLWLLMEHHLDFHIVDTDILENGQIEDGCLHVADITAQVVLMPPMPIVEEPLQRWLETYQAAGGTVLFISDHAALDGLKTMLCERVRPGLSLQVNGAEYDKILAVKRVGAERTFWFLQHLVAEPVTVTLNSGGFLREIPFRDEPVGDLHFENGHYRRQISPFESFVLEAVSTNELPKTFPRITIPVSGAAEIRCANANLVRLGQWQMALREDQDVYGPAVTVPAIPLMNQLILGQFRFRPAYQEYFGQVADLSLPELSVRYTCHVVSTYSGAVHLLMEPGSIMGDWQISVNHNRPLTARDFQPTDAHVRGSRSVDITTWLHPGDNLLQVDVRTARPDGGLLNPLYLAGAFGVTLQPLSIVPPVTVGQFEAYEENLLPYYAGMIEYTTEFQLAGLPESEEVIAEFEYPLPFHEATEVSINGSAYQPVLWQPRCLKLKTSCLRVGQNTLSTKVYTTQIRAFEGQWFDYQRHAYRSIEMI